MESRSRRSVAVVGSGVAGLTAAYVLQRTHDVTLFEAEDRLGGHAHTHDVSTPDGRLIAVDSGFIVHNQATYPTLLRLFDELNVSTRSTEMSLSIRCDGCGLEYAGGRGLAGIVAQPRRLVSPAYVRLLGEARKFYVNARRLLAAPAEYSEGITLGGFLALGGYSTYFRQHFIVPIVSSVWSAGSALSLLYPARYLFEFLMNHGALSLSGSPVWRTVVGGSRTYVERAAKGLTAVETAAPVRTVHRTDRGARIRDDADRVVDVDAVVIATHADQALSVLADPTPRERAVLGAFGYSHNETLLHTDRSVLPRARGARGSWNYRMSTCDQEVDVPRISYWMNRLQGLDEPEQYVVSLNSAGRVDPNRVLERMVYEHPIYTPESVAAQRELPLLPDESGRRTVYAGAYHGWGFHEDGCVSGLRAAQALGATWERP